MNFNSKIEDITVYGLPSHQESECSDIIINWDLEMDAREWGVKSFYGIFRSLTGGIGIKSFDKDDNEISDVEHDINDFNLEIVMEIQRWESGFYSPNEIEIDFKNNKITIS